MALKLSTRLKNHLMKTDQHIGRQGRAMFSLANRAGVSAAMLQSVAKGRRNFSDTTAEKVDKALKIERELWAKVIR